MSGPVRVLIFGAGPLSQALRAVGKERSRLDSNRLGASALCSDLGQMRQLLELWRGEREIPNDVASLCATARRPRTRAGSAPFGDIDAAVLEPVSPVELVFRGASLSWVAIVKELLAPIRALGPGQTQVAARWLRACLLAADEDRRAEAAAELADLVRGEGVAADFARAVILETRPRLIDPADALRTIQTLIGMPVGVIVGSPRTLAAERDGDCGDSFRDTLALAARQLNIPIFQAPGVAIRNQVDAPLVPAPDDRPAAAPPPGLIDAAIEFIAEVADSDSWSPPSAFDGTPSPFSPDHVYTRIEEKRTRSLLESKGVRTIPFPFRAALAIVSDVDGSSRPQYDAYTSQLSGQFGLDFGDSTWLQWNYAGDQDLGAGFGFFSPDGTTGRAIPPTTFNLTRTLFESVAAYHAGNVDHFHAFFNNGPQVVVASARRDLGKGRAAFDLSCDESSIVGRFRDFCVVGLCVVGKKDRKIGVRALTVQAVDGGRTDDYRRTRYDAPPDGRDYHLFSLARPADDPRSAPKFSETKNVVVALDELDEVGDIERIFLLSAGGASILESLDFLRTVYNINMTLITEHAAQHFRNPVKSAVVDREFKWAAAKADAALISGNGTLIDANDEFVFATDADHPHSLFRVFPEISSDFDVRFIVPKAAAGAMGFSPFELVTPSPTRAGGGVYWARRVLPALDPAPGGPPDKTRRSTFAARVEKVLEVSDGAPGRLWPIYTHLGALEGEAVPVPYFDKGAMAALQDRAFNVSGAIPPSGRIWVVRASVIYDYALMLRSIGPHIARPGPDAVSIASWRDPVLGKAMPASKGQLYGLTFYVGDPARADVRLDGEPLKTLFLNPPDETGRPSVTIAECDIRHLLFDDLDPTINRPDEVRLAGGGWTWRPRDGEDRAFGRLAVSAGGSEVTSGPASAGASLTVPLNGWTAMGAQLATFAVRRGACAFALEFETQNGGRFCFGDRSFVEARRSEFTASYAFDPALFAAGGWRTLAVPFHDLAWNPAARPGGPLPSHPLKSMTVRCLGGGEAAVDVAGLAFPRPRASAVAATDGFCLGGELAAFAGGETVRLVARDGDPGERREMTVDQRGFFCFDRVPRGIYEVWAETASGPAHDRRGPLVEVGGDTMTLVLAGAAPEAV